VSVLQCCGRDVGLPAGYMGNSEVGHLNLGAGRIVYQDMARIDMAVESGELARHPVLTGTLDKISERGGRVHFLGLLSDAGVHSHIAHLETLIAVAAARKVPVVAHPVLDGRDTPPHSGAMYLERLLDCLRQTGAGRVGTLCGRFYAMDRDKRWERVQKAWNMLVNGQAERVGDPLAALRAAYAADETDEFIRPRIVGDPADAIVRDNDGIVFFNFRADRARELAHAFTDASFAAFDRGRRPDLAGLVCMVPYDEDLHAPVLFDKEHLAATMGETVAALGIRQLRIAETEKYAHVTYFFNGGREEPFSGEDRVLVPSPRDVATYDLKPAMSVYEVTEKLLAAWNGGQYGFVVCNLANPDMVGHTGSMPAVLEALGHVDACVGRIAGAVEARGGRLAITADHGNADEMIGPDGQPCTSHSHNPVRLAVWQAGSPAPLRSAGRLADVAPTLLHLWQTSQPAEMTGQSLVVPNA
jgi:2,3-bisphosphoglycerate-independent phosphoglycerate mutase